MANGVRRGAVAVVVVVATLVVLVGVALAGGGATAQVPPSSSSTSTTTTTTAVDETTTTVDSATTEPPVIAPAPPELTVTLTYACPVSAGGGAATRPVPGVSLMIVNRGGGAVVDVEVRGVAVARAVEVPTSFLGIPQQLPIELPPGEPDDAVEVTVLHAGTGEPLATAGSAHRPTCESLVVHGAPPPAAPRSGRPTFTG